MALTDEQTKTLEWALGDILGSRTAYERYRDYYAGDQTRMMSDARLAKIFGELFDDFTLNLCQPVVDSLADRLSISSFSSDGENEDESALEIWKRNRMRRRSGQVHLEAIALGDAYVIVWPDPLGRATFYPHGPTSVTVEYDEDTPGLILRAAKLWSDKEKRDRLTIYFPDRIERYATPPKATPYDSTSGAYSPFEDFETPNPYGIVPVFHFANNADLGSFGSSELHNAIPVQNALNFQAFHMLVGTEFQGFRQRWATGIEIQKDAQGVPINPFTAGPERVWVAGNADEAGAKFGEFGAADLTQLDNVKRSWALDMAQVTQTPPHYFFSTSQMVSGESQKTAEQKLDAKVTDRQESFGDVWASAMALAVRMDRASLDGLELDANWKDLKPRNELESWQVAEMKAELGVSKTQILKELGYTMDQIEQFASEDEAIGLGQEPVDPMRQLANNVLGNANGNGNLAIGALE